MRTLYRIGILINIALFWWNLFHWDLAGVGLAMLSASLLILFGEMRDQV